MATSFPRYSYIISRYAPGDHRSLLSSVLDLSRPAPLTATIPSRVTRHRCLIETLCSTLPRFPLQSSFLSISHTGHFPPELTNHSRTLDPLFALLIGVSAAGMRIRKEENEKRLGMATTSIVGAAAHASNQKPEAGSHNEPGEEIGYGEIASIGWGRLRKQISGAVHS